MRPIELLTDPAPKHPAKYNRKLLTLLSGLLQGYDYVLDPFAGTGETLLSIRPDAWLNEIEPRWAAISKKLTFRSFVGDATDLPWPDGFFDAIVTSPCLTQDQRILTADLKWIPAGEILEGQKIVAFDEFGTRTKPGGQISRRQLRIATVTESYPARKECVRVNLENGESITCTFDHPWLATRYADNSSGSGWVEAQNLMKLYDPHVLKQFDTWETKESWKAGWLAGILDGEGSLSYGIHGSPKLMMTQAAGDVIDQFERSMRSEGYTVTRYAKSGKIANKPIYTIYVNGGFPEIFKVIGELRPTRLLNKIFELEMKGRTVQPQKVRVISVESIGEQDIQGITTSTGTYIGEGYLHHNTYGNRMADHHEARDTSKRNTYRHTLGEALQPRNTGQMQWGKEYRALHELAWKECWRVLRPQGRMVLNVKDHIRNGQLIDVVGWHTFILCSMGFQLSQTHLIPLPGLRQGANYDVRVDQEFVLVFKKLNF